MHMHAGAHIDPRLRLAIRGGLSIVAIATVFVTIVLSAFHQPAPHALPLGIVATPQASAKVELALEGRDPGGFDLRAFDSPAAARSAIETRVVDGALVVTGRSMELMTADAAGTAAAGALTATFTALAARGGDTLAVHDVVPPLASDADALSPFFIVLAVLFPSLAAGVLIAQLLGRGRRSWRVGAALVVAVSIGLVVSGVADGISGLGNYGAVAGIVALFSLAVTAPTAALGRIRSVLVGLAGFLFLLVGLPVSGGPGGLAPFGPGFLRWLDSALPLGVASSVVRNVVYFHGNGVAAHL